MNGYLSDLKDWWSKFINLLLGNGSKGDRPQKGNRPIIRQELLDQVFEHFESRFEEYTTDESMLFPTSFCIYLHQDDYQKQVQGFGITARDTANKFHKFIRKKLSEYPDYIPHATYWLFQFVLFREKNIVDGQDGEITSVLRGEPITVSSIFSTDFSSGNISMESNIRATKRNKDSNTMEQLNLNQDAFLGMDVLAKDRIRIDFSKNFGKITINPVSFDGNPDESQAIAVLSSEGSFFVQNGQKGNKYLMTNELIHISGINDNRQGAHIVRLDNKNMVDSHVQIKYLSAEKKFQLAAFGKVKLNERSVQESSGGNINWVNLVNNSGIFINNEVEIKFKINK